jgi:GntR family transcriptional regulator
MSRAPQTPRYHETYRRIAERIEAGELHAGERLPSERWFCDELGVSRTTVRRAIEELVAAGLVETVRGLPVVAAADPRREPNRLISLTELARQRGLTASARVLAREVRPATHDEAERFATAAGADLLVLRRLRLIDGLEVAIDEDLFPLRRLPGAMSIDFAVVSLYAALEEAGSPVVRSRLQIEATLPTEEEATLLDLEPTAPVLVSVDPAPGAAGVVVNVGRTVFRSDRHRFLVTFTRDTDGPRP